MANNTERIGINHVGEIAERNQWMFREQPINDIGIDAHMELTEPTGKSKQLLALQIKSGISWFEEKKDNYIIFRDINERQYNYWAMNTLPCIIVLYNPDDNLCIWQKLTAESIERTNNGKGKGFFVKVPLNQIFLDNVSNNKLISLTNLPHHIANYNFLLSQRNFMKIIQDGGQIKLHSEEWINNSSGRGNMEFIVNDGKSIKKYSYPYWFPFTPYIEVFSRLFPWADFTADEDFLYEDDRRLWREYHCYFDKEIGEWLVVGDEFDDFRKKLNPLRSIIHSGEVAEYMLNISLNELGKSFLNVDEYVSKIQPYTDIRPKGEENERNKT